MITLKEEIEKAAATYEKNKLAELGITTNTTGAFKEGFLAGAYLVENKIKDIAVEFAKWILSKEITSCKSMSESITYIPKEFNLLKGELIVAGDKIFDEFIKTNNE